MASRNARWIVTGITASAGDHSITFAHAAIAGNNPWGSVSYKAIVCASPLMSEDTAEEARVAEETPTPDVTPEVTETMEDGESTPVGDHTATPTLEAAEEGTPTPEPNADEDGEEAAATDEALPATPTAFPTLDATREGKRSQRR